jgi:hypothetical protein
MFWVAVAPQLYSFTEGAGNWAMLFFCNNQGFDFVP